MFRVKICGIKTVEDALMASDAGADALGLNFYQHSPRCVSVEDAVRIAEAVPAEICRVGVFVNERADVIRSVVERVGLDWIQLHGDEPPQFLDHFSDIPLIRAFRCRDVGWEPIQSYLKQCCTGSVQPAAILLDAYAANAYGGTGHQLDWDNVARRQRSIGEIPTLLAGGLNVENVGSAISIARPTGVDVASGVEAEPGIKSKELVTRFIAASRKAFDETR